MWDQSAQPPAGAGRVESLLHLLCDPRLRLEERSATRTEAPPLHVCVACGSRLVELEGCTATSGLMMEVELRCPECEHRREDVVPESDLLAFDVVAADAEERLRGLLRALARERIADDVDGFRRSVG